MPSCWNCDSPLGALRKVQREELCPGCQAWIHACKNCAFWDDGARSCDEPAAEWVHDRERANFCDFFALSADDGERPPTSREGEDRPASGRDDFDALFKS